MGLKVQQHLPRRSRCHVTCFDRGCVLTLYSLRGQLMEAPPLTPHTPSTLQAARAGCVNLRPASAPGPAQPAAPAVLPARRSAIWDPASTQKPDPRVHG